MQFVFWNFFIKIVLWDLKFNLDWILKSLVDQVVCVSHNDGAECVGGRGSGAVDPVGDAGRRAGGRDQGHDLHAHGGH